MPESIVPNGEPANGVKRHWSFRDKTGERFGRLLVLGTKEPYEKPYHWRCRCDCGKTVNISAANLGHSTNSCGCLNSKARTTHDMSRSKTYISWQSMLRRCSNKQSDHYHNYGGRGIRVCPQWSGSFESFFSDMGIRPAGHTIERKDVNGNYEPSNCRWATSIEQARNRRSNIMLTAFGKTQCINDWRKEIGLSFPTIVARINKGWSPEEVVSVPSRGNRPNPSVSQSV